MILHLYLFGLLIGLGFIIPGVSGGVIATILGLYDKIIDSILNFNKDIKKNILFLTPLALGIVSSVFFLSKIILYLLDNHLEFISYVFIGLILGCVPYLIKEIKIKTKKKIMILPFFITFSLGILLFILERNINITSPHISVLKMLLAGSFYAFGKIVPGISGAFLLMLIGVYEYLLEIIANPFLINIKTIITLIPFLISFLISAYFLLKLMHYLLNKHFRITYSAIIGFVISSTIFIIPNAFSITSLIIIILSFIISYYLSA